MIATDIESLAEQAAGNWAKFDSFAWFEPVENPADVAIVYTSNRDSDILDKANAQAIAAELAAYIEGGDVVEQRHSHWACGYVDGYAIRVYDDEGNITDAFRCWCELQAKLEDYPILDESLYSELECEAQAESWELWARRDFVRAVESALDVDLDDSDLSEVCDLFETLRQRSNTDWDSDSIDIDRIAKAATFDDVRELIVPVVLTVYRDGFILARGMIRGDEWQCEPVLYEPEFEACMEARDNGAEFVNLNGILTWGAE